MVLEATFICLDTSDWMRNGDYVPSRIEAQQDAANIICGAKTQQNPENTVGLLAMAGKTPEVLMTPTSDFGKVLSAMHGLKPQGKCHFSKAIQVAQLALKHRQNKSQKQRIVLFIGSPIEEDDKELAKLGKRLKRNNVAVDVINFGEETTNTPKLEAFLAAVNNNENSHLVTVPPGPHILSDVLISTPILMGEEAGPSGTTTGGSAFEFGVDPNLDPELALALRMSLEEERQRQERVAGPTPASVPPTATDSAPAHAGAVPMDEEEAMLQEALALSMEGVEPTSKSEEPSADKKKERNEKK